MSQAVDRLRSAQQATINKVEAGSDQPHRTRCCATNSILQWPYRHSLSLRAAVLSVVATAVCTRPLAEKVSRMRNSSKSNSYFMALLTLLNVPPIRVPSSRAPPMMATATRAAMALRSRCRSAELAHPKRKH